MGYAEWIGQVRGKLIERVEVEGEAIRIALEGGHVVSLEQIQDCCERRYFVADDDLAHYVGAELRDIKLARWLEINRDEDRGEAHEIAFLDIHTTKGVISICAHNEHNGYYGGISAYATLDGGPMCRVPHEVGT